LLATGSYDHTAAIWDVASGKRLHQLAGHRGIVMSVAFSPDKKTLATASIDGTVKLWEVATGRLQNTLTGHKSWVNALAYDSDGDRLFSGSSDGTIIVWSAKTGAPLHTLLATDAEVRSLAVSPDGVHLAAGLRYGSVKLWTLADRKERLTLPGHGDMCAVAFSPDGKLLATSEGDWNRGGLVKIRDTTTGKPLARFQHTGEVLCLSFSRDGHTIAAGAADKSVKLWNVASEGK
jgi:WD40 repeat protein